MNDKQKIIDILKYSDIVWPRYGSESVEELAEKILNALKVNEASQNQIS